MSQPLKVLLADTREVDDSNEVMPAAVLFAYRTKWWQIRAKYQGTRV
jgi:hypothetical protein